MIQCLIWCNTQAHNLCTSWFLGLLPRPLLAFCGSSMLLSLRMYTAQGQACALGVSCIVFLRDLDVGAPSVSIVWGPRRMARLGPARSECLCSRPALVGVGVSRMCRIA